MTEELKIFNKPDGKLKTTIFLGKSIISVSSNLNRKLRLEDRRKLGSDITLPEFNYPFAICTAQHEIMVLWAESNYERGMWVNALTALMQSNDPDLIDDFAMKKTKKNKFVYELLDCLKEGFEEQKTDSKARRSRTTAPP